MSLASNQHRPLTQVERDIKEIDALLTSRGWEVLRAALQADVDHALAALSSSRPMPTDEIHYRRGALAAAINMVRLPEAVTHRLVNERTLHPDAAPPTGSKPLKTKPPTQPATAG